MDSIEGKDRIYPPTNIPSEVIAVQRAFQVADIRSSP
jgi:hypothetical protein